MELFFRRRIAFGTAVIVVNYRPTVMSPVLPFGMPVPVVGSMPPVAEFVPISVRRTVVLSPVEFGLETVHRPIVVLVTLGMITPAVVPVKFVNSRFIPFLKMAAAIPMTSTATFALGP